MNISVNQYSCKILPLSVPEFLVTHQRDIQPVVDWGEVIKLPLRMVTISSREELGKVFTVWADGPWHKGSKKRTVKEALKKEGKDVPAMSTNALLIIRVPGVMKGNKVMLLDGNHRAMGLYKSNSPFVVIVDAFELPKGFRGVLDTAFNQI